MAWSKLKNIIILILLLFNLFLLLLIVGEQIRTNRYEADTLSQTLKALSLNGIAVEETALPEKTELLPLKLSHNSTMQAEAARILLNGEDYIASYSGALNVYTSLSGSVSFRASGEFSATLSTPCAPDTTYTEHASSLLEQLGIATGELTVSGSTVTALPTLDGIPVFNLPVTLVYNEQLLLSASGCLPGQLTPESEQPLLSVPDMLVSVLEYVLNRGIVCRSITRITPGYTAAALSDSLRLTPCWLVETDTANYYVDALSGAVTPING